MADKSGRKAPPSLDSAVQSHIGRRLRSMFDEVANQPVPDRFRDLLDQLENASEDDKAPPTGERQGKLADLSEVGASGAPK